MGLHVDWSQHDDGGKWTPNWDASGVSGGPLWTVTRDDGTGLWSAPDRARLIGIAFFEDARGTGAGCVRATPITEWARLVHEHAEGMGRPEWRELLVAAGLVTSPQADVGHAG